MAPYKDWVFSGCQDAARTCIDRYDGYWGDRDQRSVCCDYDHSVLRF